MDRNYGYASTTTQNPYEEPITHNPFDDEYYNNISNGKYVPQQPTQKRGGLTADQLYPMRELATRQQKYEDEKDNRSSHGLVSRLFDDKPSNDQVFVAPPQQSQPIEPISNSFDTSNLFDALDESVGRPQYQQSEYQRHNQYNAPKIQQSNQDYYQNHRNLYDSYAQNDYVQQQPQVYKPTLRELEMQKQREREMEMQRQREAEMQRQREMEMQRQREMEAQRQRDMEMQRQREMEMQRQREIEMQRRREMEMQRQREMEAQRQREMELQRQREEEAAWKAQLQREWEEEEARRDDMERRNRELQEQRNRAMYEKQRQREEQERRDHALALKLQQEEESRLRTSRREGEMEAERKRKEAAEKEKARKRREAEEEAEEERRLKERSRSDSNSSSRKVTETTKKLQFRITQEDHFLSSYAIGTTVNMEILNDKKEMVYYVKMRVGGTTTIWDRDDRPLYKITNEDGHLHNTYAIWSSRGQIGLCKERFKLSQDRKFNYKRMDNAQTLKMVGKYGGDFVVKKNFKIIATVESVMPTGYNLAMTTQGSDTIHLIAHTLIMMQRMFTKEDAVIANQF